VGDGSDVARHRSRSGVRRRLARDPEGCLQPKRPTRRFPSATPAWPRIELGLVDELRLFRYPVVVGGGTPFLPPVTEKVPLDLIETRTFGSRVIHERYGRARGDSE
jgi:hypothetical protein